MFELRAEKNSLDLLEREMLTSGSVNIYPVRFAFSDDWDGLTRTAVFQAGSVSRSVLLDGSGTCTVPWEVLKTPGVSLSAGVYGEKDGDVVLPTIWARLGLIMEGAAPGEDARPPTPDLWQQELAKKGDRLAYTETGELGLYAGENVLSSVPVEGGGSGTAYKFGHGLKVTGNTVSVDAVSDFKGDNTLPMTAAGVQTTVGNIEALLGTI